MARQGIVQRKYTDDNGRIHYVYGKTVEEAEIKRDALKYGGIVVDKNMKVDKWREVWLETKIIGKEPHYAEDVERASKKAIEGIEQKKICRVNTTDLQRIINRAAITYSKSYLNKIYNTQKRIFEHAWGSGLIDRNITLLIEKPAGKVSNHRRAITDKEREITLETAKTHRGGIFVLIMLYSGLRPGEVAALKWKNIDFEEKYINVVESCKTGNVVGYPKTSAGLRQVPLVKPLEDILYPLRGRPDDLITTNAHGNLYTKASRDSMWRDFKLRMSRVGECDIADDLVLYCYRHTFCTDLQSAGVPLNVAKEWMGHEKISTTAEIYTHKSSIADIANAEILNKFHSKNSQNEH